MYNKGLRAPGGRRKAADLHCFSGSSFYEGFDSACRAIKSSPMSSGTAFELIPAFFHFSGAGDIGALLTHPVQTATRDAADREWASRMDRFSQDHEFRFVRRGGNLSFAEDTGYTYRDRIWNDGQLDKILSLISERRETRQALLMVYNPSLDVDRLSKGRIPCSIGYQVFLRQGALHMVYMMRTADLINIFAADLYLAEKLKSHFAEKLSVISGDLTVLVNNLHVYREDMGRLAGY